MALSTNIYSEVTTTFPASVEAGSGITIVKSGGVYTVSFDPTGIAINSIGNDNLAQVFGQRLIGNPTAAAAARSEISLGSDLEFSGTTLRGAALTGVITKDAGGTVTSFGTGAVDTANLVDGAVTEPKIGAGAVTAAKIDAAAVTETKIGTGVVTPVKLATQADLTILSNVSGSVASPLANTLSAIMNAHDTLNLNNKQVMYYPTGFAESSLFIGDGGSLLEHTTALEGYFNTSVGFRCLTKITRGSYNTGVGFEVMEDLTTGHFNTFIGEAGGIYLTTGVGNSGLGWKAGHGVSGHGKQNYTTFIGYSCGLNVNNGADSNTGVGAFTFGIGQLTGTGNTGFGRQTLYNLTSGTNNLSLGNVSGLNVTTGSNNTLVGASAGGGIATGSHNTIVGNVTGLAAGTTQNVILADGAAVKRFRADTTSTKLVTAGDLTTLEVFNNVASTNSHIAIKPGILAGQASSLYVPSGNVMIGGLGTNVALATTATVGFMMIPTCAGTPTGTPAGTLTGAVALVWNSTGNTLHAYEGGAWNTV